MADQDFVLHPIAHIESDFADKFGIPRQSGLVDALRARIVFEPEYRDPSAFRGLEQFSHVWLLWQFTQAVRDKWSPTVRPPRLGGNTRMGVFATRSPFRPNAIGLSCVRLLSVEHTQDMGTVLHIGGADLMDGTPILDIKPYIPYCDAHPEAMGGFTQDAGDFILEVDFPENLKQRLPAEKQEAICQVLSHDPRPSYQMDSDRVYGLSFAGFDIRFTVKDTVLTVVDVQ